MNPSDQRSGDEKRNNVPLTPAANAPNSVRSIFDVPPPLKRIFDHFPVKEYEPNDLPVRAPTGRHVHQLHVFIDDDGARRGKCSWNPGCLKWQAYLRFVGLYFKVVPSSNHASPSGVLPFLQPAVEKKGDTSVPDAVPGNKLKKWLDGQKWLRQAKETDDVRFDAYASLIESRVRKAWLYQLYLAPQNDALMRRLYVETCSSNRLVQFAIARQLRAAAESELVKSAGKDVVDVLDLMHDVEEAFDALSTLLGEHDWFFGQEKPGLFDASLFSYSHLILDEQLGWTFNPLKDALERHGNLVRHSKRVWEKFF